MGYTGVVKDESSDFVDYYRLLGVSPNSDAAEIRRSFIALAKEHHPDSGGSTELMQDLNKAYKTLMQPGSKVAYDQLHSLHTGTRSVTYHYSDNRTINNTSDMSDEEIDIFLDTLWSEFQHTNPTTKNSSVRLRVKKFIRDFPF